MHVTFATAPGTDRPNEDWCAANPQVALVLDGLSTSGLDTGCRHGVPWFVQRLSEQLISFASDSAKSLREALSGAIEAVVALHPECDVSHPGTPSATVALLRETGVAYEYLVLADASIIFDMASGIQVATDLRVDTVAVEELAETRRYAVGSEEHRRSVVALVNAQRKVRNTSAGYWVAAGNPEAAEYATVGNMSKASFRRAALVSDGAARLVTPFAEASWREALDVLQAHGPAALINRIRGLEQQDPQGKRWPRFKTSDDATAVLCLPG